MVLENDGYRQNPRLLNGAAWNSKNTTTFSPSLSLAPSLSNPFILIGVIERRIATKRKHQKNTFTVCVRAVRVCLLVVRMARNNIVMDFSIYLSLCFWSLLFCVSRAIFFFAGSHVIFAAQFCYSRIYKRKNDNKNHNNNSILFVC